MWVVVEVDDGYPWGAPMAERVWLFDSESAAYEWAQKWDKDGYFDWNVVKVSDVES